MESVADTAAPVAALTSAKVFALTVAGSTTSLNVAVTFAFRLTLVAPLDGEILLIVGGVVSNTVVNVQTRSAANALPTISFAPPEPPSTVAVYVVPNASDAEGLRVATRDVAL